MSRARWWRPLALAGSLASVALTVASPAQQAPPWARGCTNFTLDLRTWEGRVPAGAATLHPEVVLRAAALSLSAEQWRAAADTLEARADAYARARAAAGAPAAVLADSLRAAVLRLGAQLERGGVTHVDDWKPQPMPERTDVQLATLDDVRLVVAPVTLADHDAVPLCWLAQSAYRIAYESTLHMRLDDARVVGVAREQWERLRAIGYSQTFLESFVNGCWFADRVRGEKWGWPRSGCSATRLAPDRAQIVLLHPTVGSLVSLTQHSDTLFRSVAVMDVLGFVRYNASFSTVQFGLSAGALTDAAGRVRPVGFVTVHGYRVGVGREATTGANRWFAVVNLDVIGAVGRGKSAFTAERITRFGNWLARRAGAGP